MKVRIESLSSQTKMAEKLVPLVKKTVSGEKYSPHTSLAMIDTKKFSGLIVLEEESIYAFEIVF